MFLRPRPIIACIGDSLTAGGWAEREHRRLRRAYGYPFWLSFLSGQRAWCPDSHLLGVIGDMTRHVRARIGQVLALDPRPGFCVIQVGINDVHYDSDPAAMRADYDAIVAALCAAGIVPVCLAVLGSRREPPPPGRRERPSLDATRNARLHDFNRRLKARARLAGDILFADPGPAYHAAGSQFLEPAAGMTTDGLHTSMAGARVIGQAVLEAIAPFLPPGPGWNVAASDRWSPDNPAGNRLRNGALREGGGSAVGRVNGVEAGADPLPHAEIAAGCVLSNRLPPGLEVRAAKHVDAWGRHWQEIRVDGVLEGGAGVATLNLQQWGEAAGLAGGDALEALAAVELLPGSCGIHGISLTLFCREGAATHIAEDGNLGAFVPDGLSAEALKGVFRTPRHVLGQAPESISLRVTLDIALAGPPRRVSACLRIGQFYIGDLGAAGP